MSADTGRGNRVLAGRYALAGLLGRGGMGTVWLATDQVLGRQVAVKELTFSVELTDEERGILRERTMREARAAARLDHPHVTTVYDVVEEDGKPWLVMKHVSARSLQEVLEERGPLPPAAVARIGLDLLEALDAAHAIGIVHRDVKPANVLVDAAGRACLTDFGIATTTGDSSLTTQGALIGSPAYMAPERANGSTPGPPVDLWSLGATLYTAVEGRPPFDRGEAMATLLAVVSEHPAPMLRAGPLEPVLRDLLTKEPARRGTTGSVRPQLQAVATGRAAAPADAPAPPPPVPGPVPGNSMTRIEGDDLRAVASASRALLGSVARDARDHARVLADRRRERKASERPAAGRPVAGPRPRHRRFRRWVVIPVLTTVVLVLVLLVGAGLALAALLDLF
ncbi:protein kinase-like protein [Blastococcus colisei]|uniref:non-specific serine/threonine protein kinase n=1 Tax=Blastococcus colisei TaxID=1564162 RepID=A0A543PI72_9ACTN|nr:serine/threonine-protein kinase [Blastococcus colisei]TQN43765.1 protein kinase-like protein [Blastococcus colisei]